MAAQSLNLSEFSEKHLPAKAWEDDHASSDFDLRDFFKTLRRRKLTMLITLMAFIGMAALYLIITPSHYYASSSILIDPRLGRGLSLDPTQPNSSQADASSIDSQVKLLTSQEVLARVVKSLNLEHDPEFGLKPPGLLARLFGRTKDQSKEDLTPVLKALDDAITIKRPERTYLVEI